MNHITPYILNCNTCGTVYLTEPEYERQLEEINKSWKCPFCGEECSFNSELLETFYHCGGNTIFE